MGEAVLTDVVGDSIKINWFNQAFIVRQFSDDESVN